MMGTSTLDAALDYAARGWRVVPLHGLANGHCTCGQAGCNSAGKHPWLSGWPARATTDPAVIRGWWQARPGSNVGIATGAGSDLLVLDVDGETGRRTLGGYEALHGPLPPTPTVVTGSGGRHYYFRHAGGLRNEARFAPGLDIRTDGGQAVAPPSLHRSGKAYAWAEGRSPAEVAVAECPEWLLEIMRVGTTANERPTREPASGGEVIPEGQRNARLASIAGAMRRQGADEPAILAALRAVNARQCQPPLDERELESIARSIARYPAEPDGVLTVHGRPVGGPAAGASDGWEPPLTFFEPDLPAFPTEALPAWLRSYVEALSVALQVPADLPGLLSLAVLAAVTQKSVVVEPRAGWREQMSLFAVVALPSGTRKSAALAALTRPLEEYEAEQVRALAGEVAEAESNYQALKAKVASLQGRAGKAEDPKEAESLKRQAAEAAVELANTTVPALPRLLADDITPEKLASLLALHGGRLAVFSPEGTLFDLMQARYGNAPNFDVFLKAHCGDTLRVDRIGRPAEYVPEPALTLGLAPQPSVLRGLAATPALRGRGLLARLLYAWPPSPLGHREVEPPPAPTDLADAYTAGVRALLRLRPHADALGRQAIVLTLSPGAYQAFIAFCRWLEPQLAEDGELGSVADWAGKLAGAVARIAGLLHLAEHAAQGQAWGAEIECGTVENAIRLGHYLLAHARATFIEMGADEEVEDAKYLLRWIEKSGLTEFTKRDAWRGTRGRFKQVEALERPLALLCEHKYIRERQSEPRQGPGRKPSPVYEVNPNCGHCGHSGHTFRGFESDAEVNPNSGHCGHSGHTFRGFESDADAESGLRVERNGYPHEAATSSDLKPESDTTQDESAGTYGHNGQNGQNSTALDTTQDESAGTYGHNGQNGQISACCPCGMPAVGLDAAGRPWCRVHWWNAAPGSALPSEL